MVGEDVLLLELVFSMTLMATVCGAILTLQKDQLCEIQTLHYQWKADNALSNIVDVLMVNRSAREKRFLISTWENHVVTELPSGLGTIKVLQLKHCMAIVRWFYHQWYQTKQPFLCD